MTTTKNGTITTYPDGRTHDSATGRMVYPDGTLAHDLIKRKEAPGFEPPHAFAPVPPAVDIEAIVAERMAALKAEQLAMVNEQLAQDQAALDAEINLFNQTQQAIANAQAEQLKREGAIKEKIDTLRKAQERRDSMFPSPPASDIATTPAPEIVPAAGATQSP